jgi:hypothetical protein
MVIWNSRTIFIYIVERLRSCSFHVYIYIFYLVCRMELAYGKWARMIVLDIYRDTDYVKSAYSCLFHG